jgi:FkbM family methyltransferase
MVKLFFFINNVSYLLKTNLSTNKKISILIKGIELFMFWWIKNLIGRKSFKFSGLKIHGLNYVTLNGLFGEIFVRNEYKFYTQKINPRILDLGANIWMATIYFKWLYPSAEIISFEPDNKHFKVLQKNITTNKLSNTLAEEKAVTNKTWEVTFYTDDKPSFSMSTKRWRMAKIETKVKSISISEIIKDRDIDLLKMDIEWWEFDVLEQLDISGGIKHIHEMIIEYHHNISEDSMSLAKFLEILEKNWFACWLNTTLFPLEAKNKFQDIFIHAYRK